MVYFNYEGPASAGRNSDFNIQSPKDGPPGIYTKYTKNPNLLHGYKKSLVLKGSNAGSPDGAFFELMSEVKLIEN